MDVALFQLQLITRAKEKKNNRSRRVREEKDKISVEDNCREAEDVSLDASVSVGQFEKVPNFMVSQALFYSTGDQLLKVYDY